MAFKKVSYSHTYIGLVGDALPTNVPLNSEAYVVDPVSLTAQKFITYDGANWAAISEPLFIRRKAADKPLANSVPLGTVCWSVDTDPHMDALEASNGSSWAVI